MKKKAVKYKQRFPEPTVGGLIFNPEGKILLMKSHKWRGKYVIPGGHIELGEKMEAALKREIKEETGLDIFGVCLPNQIVKSKFKFRGSRICLGNPAECVEITD